MHNYKFLLHKFAHNCEKIMCIKNAYFIVIAYIIYDLLQHKIIVPGIDQRMANQKDPSQIVTEVMLPEMIEGNKDVSNADKRSTSKGTAWQKMSICTKRKKQKKT